MEINSITSLILYHHPQRGWSQVGQILLGSAGSDFSEEYVDIWEVCDRFSVIFLGWEIAIAAVLKVIRVDAAIAEIQNTEEIFMTNPKNFMIWLQET